MQLDKRTELLNWLNVSSPHRHAGRALEQAEPRRTSDLSADDGAASWMSKWVPCWKLLLVLGLTVVLAVAAGCTSLADSASTPVITKADLRSELETLGDDLAEVSITVRLPAGAVSDAGAGTGAGTARLTLAQLGVTLDVDATLAAVQAIRQVPDDPTGANGQAEQVDEQADEQAEAGTPDWQPLETDPADAQLRFQLEPDLAQAAISSSGLLDAATTQSAQVIVHEGALAVRTNPDFVAIDYSLLLATLANAVTTGSNAALASGIDVVTPKMEHPAVANPQLYIAAVDEANATFGHPPALIFEGRPEQLPLEMVATWLEVRDGATGVAGADSDADSGGGEGSDAEGSDTSGATIILNTQLIQPAIEQLFSTTTDETELAEGVFVVERGQVRIEAADEAVVCCSSGTASEVAASLDDANGGGVLTLTPRPAVDAEQLAYMESLQIVERVARFTTYHPCCKSRVTNIQQIADLVSGAVIAPGDSLSINDRVGRRTEENGFVTGGFIKYGVLIEDIGGGISQFATTMFNAAFFAGLDITEYQMHSLYFARYPYGREATLSFPAPDLVVHNQTPYGALVITSHTDTSISVSIYSTKHIEVDVEEQTETERGECTRVRTTRNRDYLDGSKESEQDSFFATYRPQEGYNCNGEPSDPEAVLCPDPAIAGAEGEEGDGDGSGAIEDEADETEFGTAPPESSIGDGGAAGEGAEATTTTVCVPRFVRPTTSTTPPETTSTPASPTDSNIPDGAGSGRAGSGEANPEIASTTTQP